ITTGLNDNVYVTGGSGIVASSGTGTVVVNNNALTRGTGSGTGDAVIRLSSAGGGVTLNNNATGVVSSGLRLISDVAIAAVTGGTGAITINNAGRITGRMDLSGASSSTFNNTSALSWHTSGVTTFTNGNDLLNNASGGLIATSAATQFDFLNG